LRRRSSRIGDELFNKTAEFEGVLAKKTSHLHFYAGVNTFLMMHMSKTVKANFRETSIILINSGIGTTTEDALQLGPGNQGSIQ
jgi:hypothetical protein